MTIQFENKKYSEERNSNIFCDQKAFYKIIVFSPSNHGVAKIYARNQMLCSAIPASPILSE